MASMVETNEDLVAEGRAGVQLVACDIASWSSTTVDLVSGETPRRDFVGGVWLGDALGFVVPPAADGAFWVAPKGQPELGVQVTWTAASPWASCDSAISAPRESMPEP